jgi:protein tyrosine phosphatase
MIFDIAMQITQLRARGADDKVLVHCKAGIGRTGTTVAIVNAVLFLQQEQKYSSDIKEIKISLKEIVLKLRQDRSWMCQEASQYAFIHQFLKDVYILRKL